MHDVLMMLSLLLSLDSRPIGLGHAGARPGPPAPRSFLLPPHALTSPSAVDRRAENGSGRLCEHVAHRTALAVCIKVIFDRRSCQTLFLPMQENAALLKEF